MCFSLLYSIIGLNWVGGSISWRHPLKLSYSVIQSIFSFSPPVMSSSEKVNNDLMNALPPLRKHLFIPMMSSSGMENDVTPSGIMVSRTPLNAPYAHTHAPWRRTPLFLLLPESPRENAAIPWSASSWICDSIRALSGQTTTNVAFFEYLKPW